MQNYIITNNKTFMANLLKSSIFDTFEAREVVLQTQVKHLIDGFNGANEFIKWNYLRPTVYSLISKQHTLSYFKLVLSISKVNDLQHQFVTDDTCTFFLNITFKDNQINCTTGCAYKTFTLDKSAEQNWDKYIEKLFISNNFI
ncbi:MAG: hypothetical protein ATN34_02655 [Epulopiscium sp. Nele67-Bin002]|nr:MAG: hypothetical protein ATN34_02655 [Epulopiscium sp. Nele67-Bin002]